MTENPGRIRSDDDDTEGHANSWKADAEAAEGDDDTEGHGLKFSADAESAEDEDVAGHVQPPPDFEFRNYER